MVDMMESCFEEVGDRPENAGILAEQLASLLRSTAIATTSVPMQASSPPEKPHRHRGKGRGAAARVHELARHEIRPDRAGRVHDGFKRL